MYLLIIVYFVGIVAFFYPSRFAVRENDGPVEPIIRISKALECCSLSLMIKVEDGTTRGKIIIIIIINQVLRIKLWLKVRSKLP